MVWRLEVQGEGHGRLGVWGRTTSGWVQRWGLPAESHVVGGRGELSGLFLEHESKSPTSQDHHFGGHDLNLGVLGGRSNLHLSYLFILLKSIPTPHPQPSVPPPPPDHSLPFSALFCVCITQILLPSRSLLDLASEKH